MLISKLTFKYTCFWSFTRLQRVFIFNKRVVSRLRHISTSNHHSAQFAHQIGLKPLVIMLPANISHGNDTTVLASDDDDDDEGGGDEMVRQEGRIRGEAKVKTMKVTSGKEGMMSMEIQQSTTDCGATTVTGSNEKKIKRKMRRDKRKLLKKKHKSDNTLETLMSELPFALTSPSLWKELGFTNSDSSQKKRKRGNSGGRVDSEDDVDKKKRKKKEWKRPNYFVSIPITNPQISSVITEVQKVVLEQEPRLAKAMIPIPSLHITLLVTHLANQEEVDQAATVLAGAEPLLAELLGGRDLVLPFSGIGHFRKEVVFVGLVPGQHRHTLDSLAELLRARFAEQGLLQEDCRGFEPHLTIMKLSRASKLRSQGIKRVDPALYSNYTDRFFGDQTVERVDLCSMLKKKQKDGYYHTETSLRLDLVQNPLHAKRSSGRRRSEPDEAELLRVSKRLVEDAVNRALQQYKQETLQNGGGPKATAAQPPGNAEESATKTDATANSTTDYRK